jgi:hypothetical protein
MQPRLVRKSHHFAIHLRSGSFSGLGSAQKQLHIIRAQFWRQVCLLLGSKTAGLALKQARSATTIAKNTCFSGFRPRKNPRNSAAIPAVFPSGALAISSVFRDFVTPTSLVLGLAALIRGFCDRGASKDGPKMRCENVKLFLRGPQARDDYRLVSKQHERASTTRIRVMLASTTARSKTSFSAASSSIC